MFERFKAYKKLKRNNKFLKDLKMAAEIINDEEREEMLEAINNAMAENERLLKRIIFDRKTAEKYNLEMIKHGF